MSAPLSFSLRLSTSLKFGLCLAHGVPLACLIADGVPGWARLLVSLGAGASALWQFRRVQSLRQQRVIVLSSGEACLHMPLGCVQIELQAGSVDLGWLIVLRWRELETGRYARVALTREAFEAEDWRALRRCVRWLRPPDAAQDS